MNVSLLVLISVLGWGLWGIFDKLAVRTLHPTSIMLANEIINLAFLPVYYTIWKRAAPDQVWVARDLAWVFASYLGCMAASIAYTFAIRDAEVSKVIGLTSTYPAMTLVLAAVFLREEITIQKVIGIGFIVVGMKVLS